MALVLLNPGYFPLGMFDGYDGDYLTLKGGEVVTFRSVTWQGTDKAAADVYNDGYSGTSSKVRPAVTKTLTSGNRPLFLSDDGTANYGTLFGTVVGGVVGQVVTGGASLGPHTATGSGKVTLWDKPGLYGVTLDAVDTTASTGLVPGNSSLAPGSALYATAAGLLTPNSASSFEASKVVARFIEFSTGDNLVTTPNYLAAPLSGAGSVEMVFKYAVIHWAGPSGE